MERDEIIIRNAVMHILNTTNVQLELSDTLLELGQDINDFLRNHIYKIISGDEFKKCEFLKDDSEVFKTLINFNENEFVDVSKKAAKRLFGIMNNNIDIPAADFFVVTFQINSTLHMALLKMNYKESYTHNTGQSEGEIINDIVKQKVTLPSANTKLTEAAIINLHDYSLLVIEHKYDVNGVKTNYFTNMFLQCKSQLSSKVKLNIITQAIDMINKKYFEEDHEKKMKAKSIIYKENIENGSINVNEIAKQVFGGNQELEAEFNEKIEKYNLVNEEVKVQNGTTFKRFEKQMLITDQGIEISIPMEQYLNGKNFVIDTNQDGTLNVKIMNIERINVK